MLRVAGGNRLEFYEVSHLGQGGSLQGPDSLTVGKLIGLLKAGTF